MHHYGNLLACHYVRVTSMDHFSNVSMHSVESTHALCSTTQCAAFYDCSSMSLGLLKHHSIARCCYHFCLCCCRDHCRAATLATSDTLVQRDLFYTGNIINEKASIVLRLAPTFFRFGSFEIFRDTDARTGRKGPSTGNTALLKQVCTMLHMIYLQICLVC
jgi:hypothetical protein